eukprot:756574-Hanusia_phi.AAC.7
MRQIWGLSSKLQQPQHQQPTGASAENMKDEKYLSGYRAVFLNSTSASEYLTVLNTSGLVLPHCAQFSHGRTLS